MSKPAKKGRAKARRDRAYPQTYRVFSTNFLAQMLARPDGYKCFVPLEDFLELQRRYIRMFRRMQRTKNE